MKAATHRTATDCQTKSYFANPIRAEGNPRESGEFRRGVALEASWIFLIPSRSFNLCSGRKGNGEGRIPAPGGLDL